MSRTRKKWAALTLTVVMVLIGGAAYAYWSQSGAGTSTGTTTTTTGVTVNQTSTVSAMGPGTAAQPLSGNFTNGNTSKVYVTAVTATVSGTDKTGCTATDYTITGTAAVGAEISPGTGGSWSGLSIAFVDKASTNQDACKNATVTISYASS